MAEPITKELREYVGNLANRKVDDYDPAIIAQFLNVHADRIDAEHERRMNESRIVRCRDCRWMGYIGKHPICTRGITRELVTVDDGCSRGKWKEASDDQR